MPTNYKTQAYFITCWSACMTLETQLTANITFSGVARCDGRRTTWCIFCQGRACLSVSNALSSSRWRRKHDQLAVSQVPVLLSVKRVMPLTTVSRNLFHVRCESVGQRIFRYEPRYLAGISIGKPKLGRRNLAGGSARWRLGPIGLEEGLQVIWNW